jgi:hypothetical protein
MSSVGAGWLGMLTKNVSSPRSSFDTESVVISGAPASSPRSSSYVVELVSGRVGAALATDPVETTRSSTSTTRRTLRG